MTPGMRRRFRRKHIGRIEGIRGWKSAGRLLRLKAMGLTIASFPAGKGYDHPHSHALQEEVYMLLSGRGDLVVDGRVLPMRAGDAVAVEPPAKRALRSAPRTASTWLMIGAAAGTYREDDWTEYDEPAFPPARRRRPLRRTSPRAKRGGGRRPTRRSAGR